MRIDRLPPYLYKSSMPNLCQTETRSDILRAQGPTWCGPVGGSNFLVSLARNNFQMLIPPMGKLNELEAQSRLIDRLVGYMKTNTDEGTQTADLIDGLKRYARERGYRVQATWDGWDTEDEYLRDFVPEPLDAMFSVLGTSNTILQLGWCKHDPNTSLYERVGGHFVTVAGLRQLARELIIHDPSSRSKSVPKFCVPQKVPGKAFIKLNSDEQIDIRGYSVLEGIDINKTKGANVAVAEGLGVFEVFRK